MKIFFTVYDVLKLCYNVYYDLNVGGAKERVNNVPRVG